MAHPLVTGFVETQKLARELGLSDHERDGLKVKINQRMYEGDHWLGGVGYIGAPPDPFDKHAPELWARLRRSFASYNAVKEITDRLNGAIYGQVPDYGMTVRRARRQIPKKVPDPNFIPPEGNPEAAAPMIDDPEGATVPEPLTADEETRIREAAAALEVFYSKRKPLKWLKKLFRSRCLKGRGYLRLHVPPKFRAKANGRVPFAADLNEAIQRIFISEPDIEDAVHLTEEETRDELAINRYKRGETKEVFELVFTDDATNQTFIATIEHTPAVEPVAPVRGVAGLLNASPLAAELLAESDTRLLANVPDENISDPLALNGNLTVFEQAGEPLITEQVRSQNFSMNLNLTMSNHVTFENGFRELATTNVELETEKVADERAPGGFREVPKKLKRGVGAHHNFMGVTLEDAQGNESITTPGVHVFDPVPVDTFDKGQTMFRRNILAEVHQLWALITGDAAPSGESRIQAMADFVILALDYQEECEDAGTWLTETVLYWAACLIGKPGRFNDLRANFRTRLYLGRLTPAELQQLMSEVEKRLLSRETYMMQAGRVTDPAEERARIEREDAESIEGQRARLSLEADRQALRTNTGGGENE